MKLKDLPLRSLRPAAWNANVMDVPMRRHLRRSVERFGVAVPLVVRPVEDGVYEVIGGNQRLCVYQEMGIATTPCVLIEADDADARLMSQALNRIAGEDDIGLRAELLRSVLEMLPGEDIASLLPETAESLSALSSLGQEDLATGLRAWQQAQAAKLRHLQVQLTAKQMAVVEEALELVMPAAKKARASNPNVRGTAVFLICQAYLQKGGV